MNARVYAYGGIGIIAGLCSVMAFVFYRMGFVGIAPFVLGLILVGSALIGFLVSIPQGKNKKPKKKKKKGAESVEDDSAQISE